MQNFVDAYSWINLRYLLQGLGVTLEVSIASIFFSFVLGVILGLARYVKIKYFSRRLALSLTSSVICRYC